YRLHLELICARLLLPAAAGEEGYAARLDRIERRLAAGSGSTAPGREVSASSASSPSAAGSASAGAPSPARDQTAPAAPAPTPASPVDDPAGTREPAAQGSASAPGPPAAPVRDAPAAPQDPASGQDDVVREESATGAETPGSLDTDAVRRSWPEVLDKVKEIRRVTWTLVSVNSTVLDYDGQRVVLGLSSGGLAATFNQGVHAEVVRQGLIEAIGLDARVEGTAAPGGGSGGAP